MAKKQKVKLETPSVVSIQYDRLVLILHKFMQTARKRNDWLAPFGIALSLLLTILVSDFRDRFSLTSQQWEAIIYVALFASSIWLIYTLIIAIRTPKVDALVQQILEESFISKEHRALFLFKALSNNNLYKVLVYRDVLWDCFLLPHARIKDQAIDGLDDNDLSKYIASTLALPTNSISIQYIDRGDLRSYKHSEFYRQDTTYLFNFYLVVVKDANVSEQLSVPTFNLAGKSYYWLTIDEMENDHNTAKRNIDVTRHLRDHHDLFFIGPPDSLQHRINV